MTCTSAAVPGFVTNTVPSRPAVMAEALAGMVIAG
jgi:hypothetical protein